MLSGKVWTVLSAMFLLLSPERCVQFGSCNEKGNFRLRYSSPKHSFSPNLSSLFLGDARSYFRTSITSVIGQKASHCDLDSFLVSYVAMDLTTGSVGTCG